MSAGVTCREFVEFLADYLSGDLPPRRRAVFDAHLAACPSCVAYMNTYQAAIELGKEAVRHSDEVVPEEIPEALVQAILAARCS